MPGTYLPTDIATELAALQDRVRKLESYRASPPQLAPSAFTEITGATDFAGTNPTPAPFSLVWTNVPHANAFFTLSTAASVLVLAALAWVGNGGTANYVNTRVVVIPFANWPSGAVAASGGAYTATNGGGFSNATPYIVPSLAAGSYYAALQYEMNAGATTTITANAVIINVFQLGAGTVAIP